MLIIPNIYIRRLQPVGSQVTCEPTPDINSSDYDFLCHVWSKRLTARRLRLQGWAIEGPSSSPYRGFNSAFFSARLHDHNLIVTSSTQFYNRFLEATQLCKKLNLQSKEDRVTLFQYVLYKKIN